MVLATSVDVDRVVADMDAIRASSGLLVDSFISLSISVFLAYISFRIIRSLFI